MEAVKHHREKNSDDGHGEVQKKDNKSGKILTTLLLLMFSVGFIAIVKAIVEYFMPTEIMKGCMYFMMMVIPVLVFISTDLEDSIF